MKAIVIGLIFSSFCFGFFLCSLFAGTKIRDLEDKVWQLRKMLKK